MTVTNLLMVGRAVGLENFAAMKNAVRAVRTQGEGAMRLKFNNAEFVDRFIKMLPDEYAGQVYKSVLPVKTYFPRSVKEGVETIIDVMFKKFGKGSGRIDLTSVQRDANGVIASGKVKILGNKAGGRVAINTAGEGASTTLDVIGLRHGNKKPNIAEVVNGINYTETNGVGRLTADISNAGQIKKANADIQAPAGYINQLVEQHHGKSMSEIIANLKSFGR